MNPILKALAAAVVLASATYAGETTDVSLAREVDRYLEKSASKWDDANTLRPNWNKGIKFESADGAFKLGLGGRVMFDSFWSKLGSGDFQGTGFDPGVAGQNGAYFRRLRLAVTGTVYQRTKFSVQVDFAGGKVQIRNAFVGLTKVGPGDLLFGQAKEPFALQEMTSSKYIQAIERAMPVNAFAPSYHVGAFWFGSFAKQLLALGASWTFGQSDPATGSYTGNGGGAGTVRLTASPLYNKDKKTVLHVGISLSYRNTPNGVTYSARPADFAQGGKLAVTVGDAENEIRYGVEIAYVFKAINIQAEFIGVNVDSPSTGSDSPSFGGWYIELGWFVTGESRNYNRKKGAFGRTSPKRNFMDGSGGFGALQIVFRLDSLDLNDGALEGGKAATLVVGLNWHWNPNTRVMFDVAFADIDDYASIGANSGGTITSFVIRVQFDF
ncbi:MAG: OprO/OprP family phosphate-selective porin [Planctomycetota bacterium]|jgi:phosphate-selective porin OprO/OprP